MAMQKWMNFCQRLRNNVVKKDENNDDQTLYLLANYSGTAQQKDIEARTPLIEDFFRVKIDVKAFDETEMQKKGKHAADFRDNNAVFQAMANEFDMAEWGFTKLIDKKSLEDYNRKFIWQLKACNFRCPWCYVDDINKNAKNSSGAAFFSIPEIIDAFEKERKKQTLYMIRPSGGEPTLAIEQWLETLREIAYRGLDGEVCVQGDTNLSTGHFIEHLEKTGQIEEYFLHKIGKFNNLGILCSFKGTDTESFLKASGFIKNNQPDKNYAFLEDERWYTFEKFIEVGIDAYPFAYAPNPKTLPEFLEKGARKFGDNFYLKTWVLPLKLYGPEKERLEKLNINSEQYQKELDENFKKSKEIMQNLIWNKFHINYQAFPRSSFKLESLNN